MSTAAPDDERSGPKRIAKQMDQAMQEAARLAGADLPPTAFFEQLLKVTREGIGAPAGAVWMRTPQGFLQLQCQEHIEHVGLDNHKNGRQSHNELLRQAFQTAKPILLEPFGSTGILEGIPAGNPTELVVLLAPVMLAEKPCAGLLEIWQEPRWNAAAQRTFLNYLVQMAGYASAYIRNQQGRQVQGQEQIWQALEAFACRVHATLNPTEVAYEVANEGRRLIQCDRLSVALREGKKCRVEAVSGADVVEKRSTQVMLMRRLFDAVVKWDEKLVYRGTKDDALPPKVLEALDEYLAESQSKLLVLVPLHDDREKGGEKERPAGKRARSALLMECFEPPTSVEPLLGRLDVISRHAVTALYNSEEMKRIPLGLLWKPLRAVQQGIGGRTRFWTLTITALVLALVSALVFIPYPLKMDAKAKMLPAERRHIYVPFEGRIDKFVVDNDSTVKPGQPLAEMFSDELRSQLNKIYTDIESSRAKIQNAKSQLSKPGAKQDEAQYAETILVEEVKLRENAKLLRKMQEQYHCDTNVPGRYMVVAPQSTGTRLAAAAQWKILTGADFKDPLVARTVKQSEPILRVGETNGDWELVVKIPQKNIGMIRTAFATDDPDEELP